MCVSANRLLLQEFFEVKVGTLSQQALCLLGRSYRHSKLQVKISSYISFLQECIRMNGVVEGRLLHAHLIECLGNPASISVCTTLIDMYAKCGLIHDARAVFDNMTHHNVVSWTAMIASYAHYTELAGESLVLFQQIFCSGRVIPNSLTFLSILNACASLGDAELGRMIHSCMIENGVEVSNFIGNALINMYVKCDDLEGALHVFQSLRGTDVVTWTALIAGHAKQCLVDEAFQLAQQMTCEGLVPDNVTFAGMLVVCSLSRNLSHGRQVHSTLVSSLGLCASVVLESTLIDMYCKCGSIDSASRVFNNMKLDCTASRNALIVGYANHGMVEEAFMLYAKTMDHANHITFITVLKMCATHGDIERGKGIHVDLVLRGLDCEVPVGNALIALYMDCDRLEDARRVFDGLPDKDIISWTEMVVGYMKDECVDEANNLFLGMELERVQPNEITFLSIVTSSSAIGHLEQGMQIHSMILKRGMEKGSSIANALIDMYSKCGNIHSAIYVFDKALGRDAISWNTIISGYALHGWVRNCLTLANKMHQTDGNPDAITFLCILSGCSRGGLIEEGIFIYTYMVKNQQILPTVDHLVCMVDLFARVGCLDAAETMLRRLPFYNTSVVWRALLNACRLHAHTQLAACIIEILLQYNSGDASAYALLLDIFTAAEGSYDKA